MATAFIHSPDLTCLAEHICGHANQLQMERYTFPFRAEKDVKLAIREAVKQALESRQRRGVTSGRMDVQIEADNPLAGRVVDYIARIEEKTK